MRSGANRVHGPGNAQQGRQSIGVVSIIDEHARAAVDPAFETSRIIRRRGAESMQSLDDRIKRQAQRGAAERRGRKVCDVVAGGAADAQRHVASLPQAQLLSAMVDPQFVAAQAADATVARAQLRESGVIVIGGK
jgi:hypothetical protein